jgi:hypothetical protein
MRKESRRMFSKTLTSVLIVVGASILMCAFVAKAQIVQEGLISYWTFDEPDIDGDTVKDVWGNNHGTIVGDPEVVEGKVGEALKFDGEDDYVKVPHSEELDFQTDEATVEAWIYPNAIEADKHTLYRKADVTDKFIIRLNGSNLELYLQTDADSNNVMAGDIQANRWQHVLGRYDGSNLEVFIDGISVGSVEHSGDLVSDVADAYIGSRPSDRRYNGIIDEIRLYNRALSEAEIRQNMNAQGFAVIAPTRKLAISWGEVKDSR